MALRPVFRHERLPHEHPRALEAFGPEDCVEEGRLLHPPLHLLLRLPRRPRLARQPHCDLLVVLQAPRQPSRHPQRVCHARPRPRPHLLPRQADQRQAGPERVGAGRVPVEHARVERRVCYGLDGEVRVDGEETRQHQPIAREPALVCLPQQALDRLLGELEQPERRVGRASDDAGPHVEELRLHLVELPEVAEDDARGRELVFLASRRMLEGARIELAVVVDEVGEGEEDELLEVQMLRLGRCHPLVCDQQVVEPPRR
eukprot:307055-Hanusia_phi.AAC.2